MLEAAAQGDGLTAQVMRLIEVGEPDLGGISGHSIMLHLDELTGRPPPNG